MSPLCYEHSGFFFFGKFVKSTRRRNDRLQRLLVGKFLVFCLGGGCLRDLVAHDECATVYKFVIDSFLQELRRGHLKAGNGSRKLTVPLENETLIFFCNCSLISPLHYCSDYRPFFTIHDTEFKEYTTRTQAP